MSRKELIRAYKESRRPMGIYRVRNVADGRSLVGRTVDLPSALNRERTQLRFGGHPNGDLQRDWRALGPDAFAFEVLDTLTPPEDPTYDPRDDLDVLEALWRERLAEAGEGMYVPSPASARRLL
jgi:hypothetical protein